ncbi:hypothetical protein [Burkholderia stabilis]|uniref:hypothetical protein n=1 Tax=Burkholderia stabilis TaxID=95485 RepID=UPI0013CED825|nr:hypothetical protein [Burkholderia stabilis]
MKRKQYSVEQIAAALKRAVPACQNGAFHFTERDGLAACVPAQRRLASSLFQSREVHHERVARSNATGDRSPAAAIPTNRAIADTNHGDLSGATTCHRR